MSQLRKNEVIFTGEKKSGVYTDSDGKTFDVIAFLISDPDVVFIAFSKAKPFRAPIVVDKSSVKFNEK